MREQVLRRPRRASLGVLDAREQDAELVAAEAGDGVGLAQRVPQPARDLLEQQVAHVMAERVVDLLEVVEVHDHHHGGLAAAAAGADGLVDAVAEQLAVRQAGERVVERLVLLGDRLAAAAVDGEDRQEEQRDRRQAEVGGEHDDRREAEHQAVDRGLEEEVAHEVARRPRCAGRARSRSTTRTVLTMKNVPIGEHDARAGRSGAGAARRRAGCPVVA